MSGDNDEIPLEEMIRNLKKGSVKTQYSESNRGERVIREDGSEVIKVKVSKRRTRQAHKEREKKNLKWRIVVISSIVSLVILSIIAFTMFLGYYNGSKFKDKLTQTVTNASGAEVTLGKLNVSPASSTISNVNFKWPSNAGVIESLNLKKITSDYGMLSFIGGAWGDSNASVLGADLVLDLSENKPIIELSKERPVNFQIGLTQCSNVNVSLSQNSEWRLSKSLVSLRSDEGAEVMKFSIHNGALKAAKLGDFNIQSGLVALHSDKAHVYLGLIARAHEGQVTLEGEVGYQKRDAVKLDIDLYDYPLKDWFDPKAIRLISGVAKSAKGKVNMKLGDSSLFDVVMKIIPKNVVINNFPFIKSISERIQSDFYLRPSFSNHSQFAIKWNENGITFTDIHLVNKRKMSIKGGFSIDKNDQLTGLINIGLPVEELSKKSALPLRAVFTQNDGEFMWAQIKLSGKSVSPRDNLERLIIKSLINSNN